MSRSSSYPNRGRKNPFKHKWTRLNVETLEDRLTPSGNTISGFVFNDANNNGLFDPGETPLANSVVELHNSSNQVIGTATTDANGFYQFTTDPTTFTQDATLTKTVTFPSTQTNFNLSGVLTQFDPSLGQLQSVEIQHAGSITSEIKVENLSTVSQSDISGTVAGTLNLGAPGVNDALTISGYAGSFHAASYDGVTDFGGTSGTSFGQKTANGAHTVTLTGNDINAYIGTGTVNVTETGVATSNATGGGNLEVNVASTGQSTITVIYHYKTPGPLQPGQYTLVQTKEPPGGYFDGLDSHQGIVIPNSNTTDVIPVTLTNNNSPNNDFGELKPASLAGNVYVDAQNDGKLDPGDPPIANNTITLSGFDDLGPVSKTTTTATDGTYSFTNLRPGTYAITQTPPAGYSDAATTVGSQGGSSAPDVISAINLAAGVDGINNNFGEVKSASITGHVFYDANNNGKFDPTETGIQGVTMTLTGPGASSTTATTDANGFYHFDGLASGSYTVGETQPAAYLNGTDTAGTKGGTVNNIPNHETISAIALSNGDNAQNYDFGELKPASLAGNVYVDAMNDGKLDPGDPPIAGNTITLTGFDDQGPVSKTTMTATAGTYSFTNLRPGTYAITQAPPAGFTDAATTVGSQGGSNAPDVISDINLAAGVDGVNNNFGELRPSTPVPPNPLPKDVGLLGMLPAFSKAQLTDIPTMANIDPVLRGQMAFAVGANTTLTGQQLDFVGVLHAVQQFDTGTTNAQYVAQIWSTDAHRAVQVNSLYQTILNRPPTGQEQAAGIAQLQTGTDQLTLMQDLFTSPAYQQLHPTTDALATALSNDILNTNPGTASMQSLLQSMGVEPLNTVVHDLLYSDASLANQIDNTYRETVRRPATASEIQTWTASLKAGTTSLDQLAQRLLSSQEFYQLAFNTIH